jgi:hypothetical protein
MTAKFLVGVGAASRFASLAGGAPQGGTAAE